VAGPGSVAVERVNISLADPKAPLAEAVSHGMSDGLTGSLVATDISGHPRLSC
jgi:hypothetical protein